MKHLIDIYKVKDGIFGEYMQAEKTPKSIILVRTLAIIGILAYLYWMAK